MPRDATLERAVEIAVPVADAFDFHLDTRNAALISPPSTRVLGVEGTFPVTPGARVVMRMRESPSPVATTWRVRVEAVERPTRIVDVAERSPFAAWRHEHLFQPLGPDRTLMTDRVTYRLPGGPFGRIADRLLVARRLGRAFDERHRRTKALLERRAAAGR